MSAQSLQSGESRSIVGAGIGPGPAAAIDRKQRLISRNTEKTNQYFSNNPPWIKLGSSISIIGPAGQGKLTKAGIPSDFMGENLASHFTLQSEFSLAGSYRYQGFAGFGGKNVLTAAYGFGDLKYGFRPIGGITDMTVETLGDNGSIKKATIQIKAYNQMQFNIIELLYLRIGYHMLVEWGRTRYIDPDSGKVKNTMSTFLDSYWFDHTQFPDVSEGSVAISNVEAQVAVMEEQVINEANMAVHDEEYEQHREELGHFDEMRMDRIAGEGGFNPFGTQVDISDGVSEEERQRLVDGYGEEFAQEVVEESEFQAEQERLENEAETLEEELSELTTTLDDHFNDIYGKLRKKIEGFKRRYGYDYDGLIGRVTNFKWTMDSDGVYNITVDILSAGDILQSLTVNGNESPIGPQELTITKDGSNPLGVSKEGCDVVRILNNLATFCRGYKLPREAGITAYYESGNHWTQEAGEGYLESTYNLGGSSESWNMTGWGMKDKIELTDDVNDANTAEFELLSRENTSKAASYTNGFIWGDPGNDRYYKPDIFLNSIDTIAEMIGGDPLEELTFDFDSASQTHYTQKVYGTYIDDANNTYDVMKIKTKSGAQTSDNGFYISMRYYCKILQDIAVPATHKSEGKTPIARILNDRKTWLCNTHDLQISADPSKVLVSKEFSISSHLDSADGNISFPDSLTQEDSTSLSIFRNVGMYDYTYEHSNGEKYGDIMSIYLNMGWLANLLTEDDATDEFGNINFIKHVSTLCKGINDALGNINHIDFKIDEDNNVGYFFDRTALVDLKGILDSEGLEKDPLLFNVMGFHPSSTGGVMGSIVTDFDINTTISPEMSTMVTVGAQQQGTVAGYDATAFSTWNKGLMDRVYPERLVHSFIGNSKILNASRRNAMLVNFLNIAKAGYRITVFDEEDIYEDEYSDIGDSALADTQFGRWWNKTTKNLQLQKRTYIVDYDSNAINGIEITAFATLASVQKSLLVNLYRDQYTNDDHEHDRPTPIQGFIPIDLSMTFHGTSGIKIFNSYTIPTRFLPASYPSAMRFIAKKLTQKISDKSWETQINSFSIPDATGYKSTMNEGITLNSYSAPTGGGSSEGGGGGGSYTPSSLEPFTGTLEAQGGFQKSMLHLHSQRKDLWHDYVSRKAVEKLRYGTRHLSCAAHVYSSIFYTFYFYYGPNSTHAQKLTEEEVTRVMKPWVDWYDMYPGDGTKSSGAAYINCYSGVWKYYAENLPYVNDASKRQPMDIAFTHWPSKPWKPSHITVVSEHDVPGSGYITVYDQWSGTWPGNGAAYPSDWNPGKRTAKNLGSEPGKTRYNESSQFIGFYRLTDQWAMERMVQGGITQARATALIGAPWSPTTANPSVATLTSENVTNEAPIKEEYKFDKFTRKQRDWAVLYFYWQRKLNKSYKDLGYRCWKGEGVFDVSGKEDKWNAYIRSKPNFNPTLWNLIASQVKKVEEFDWSGSSKVTGIKYKMGPLWAANTYPK